ncbi:MAG TPA: hypothetical protein DF613_00930 [Lachnospiraceae bacterium]|nr:hypothetical protein [Lachnospiraceae bacterium]
MHKKQSLPGRITATGIMLLFLAVLVLGVMRLPQVYGSYSDRRTLNHPEYTENDVKVYACDYVSMEEKLQDIVFYQSRGIELQSVSLPAAGDREVSDSELAGYLQQELDSLYGLGILHAVIDLSEYDQSYRELCDLYPGNGDRMKGRISYWILSYEGEEGLLSVQMDAEYHKLYAIVMDGLNAGTDNDVQGGYLAVQMQEKYRSGTEMAIELMDALSEGFAEYYGITISEEEAEIEWGEARGDRVENLAVLLEKCMQEFPGEDWSIQVEDSIVIKADGSRLGVWSEYYGSYFMAGIQWST